MIYKTLNEVESVIALGKPEDVIDVFVASYLQGLSYEAWADGKDLEETEEATTTDDEGNEFTLTKLVHVYEEVEVDVSVWKRTNYAILRQAFYPPMAEYLDAIVKGDEEAQQAYIDACLHVKEMFPK